MRAITEEAETAGWGQRVKDLGDFVPEAMIFEGF